MKLKIEATLEFDENLMYGDKEGRAWFFNDILGGELLLHSNDLGDTVGTVSIESHEKL